MARCAAKLTDDLVAEILSRLPTKSFYRFQCVSKSWLALSSDPYHQNNFPRAASGVFFNVACGGRVARRIQYVSLSNSDDDPAIDPTLSFLHNLCNMQVISSCNGLLLCLSWVMLHRPLHRIVKAKSLYVCNPTTREWAVVPEAKANNCFRNQVLGFDPRISRHYYVFRLAVDEIFRFMIFSSKTNEWVVSEVSDAKQYYEPHATYFHGNFYATDGVNRVLEIDPEGKLCRRIELPESDVIDCLGHSGGYLHCMLQSKDEIKVWMLKDCCQVEWVLKHCVNIGAMLQRHAIPETESTLFLEFHPDVDVVFLEIEEKAFSYHLNRGRLEEVGGVHPRYGIKCVVYSPRLSKGFGDEAA